MNDPFIHPLSDVYAKQIGYNTRIWQYVVILPDATIGDSCNICSHCFIENDVFIGNRVTIKNGVQLWDGLRIEDDVFIGPNVTFTNDKHPRSGNDNFLAIETYVKKGATIGAASVILPGLTIGTHAVVAAGSVVTKSVPARTLVMGNPARIVREITNAY